MKKGDALVNAQSVFSWAVLFGHGSLLTLTNWCCEYELNVHFNWGEYDLSREEGFYRSLVLDETKFEWTPRPDLKIDVLKITWHYSE